MFNPTKAMIKNCVERLIANYHKTYGNLNSDYADQIAWVANTALTAIARSDAPYHNVEHTVLVTLVGQEILRGKYLQEGNISPCDWLHVIVSLLCHDVGYLKGICHTDRTTDRVYATGIDNEMVKLKPSATDASLTPYHIDRGKQFVEENFTKHRLLDVEVVKHNIELTRFPIPNDEKHSDTCSFAGLTRAADLIGQLSDPRYLQKIPALFSEFEEIGTNQKLGYRHPKDLRASYPTFYRGTVYPYIQNGLHHLKATSEGRKIITNLNANVMEVEKEHQLVGAAA